MLYNKIGGQHSWQLKRVYLCPIVLFCIFALKIFRGVTDCKIRIRIYLALSLSLWRALSACYLEIVVELSVVRVFCL